MDILVITDNQMEVGTNLHWSIYQGFLYKTD